MLEYITQPFLTTYRKPSSPDVGEGVLTLPLAVRREMAVRMGGLYSQRFRKPARKGGRGRPPLQLEWDGCGICRRAYTYRHTRYDARWSIKYLLFPLSHGRGVEDAAPYGWAVDRRFSNHITPSRRATQWRTGDGAPYKVGAGCRFLDTFRPVSPRASIRPRYEKDEKAKKGGWLHKTPVRKRRKSQKRLTPQSAALTAPFARGASGLAHIRPIRPQRAKKTLDKIILLCYIGLAVS